MKVIYKKDNKISISKLNIGDTFIWSEQLFLYLGELRHNIEGYNLNSINLETGEYKHIQDNVIIAECKIIQEQ